MSVFRSAEMALCQLFVQNESAFACVSELGELGLVQFTDLNTGVNAFHRKFVSELRRCDEMDRSLRFLLKEILKAKIPLSEPTNREHLEAPHPKEMADMENIFNNLELEIRGIKQTEKSLKISYAEIIELKHVLRKTQMFFDEVVTSDYNMTDPDRGKRRLTFAGFEIQAYKNLKFNTTTGVILQSSVPAFERIIWRTCRGNVFLRTADIDELIDDPRTGKKVKKSVFVLFIQGDQLKSRVQKICEGFHATIHPCSELAHKRRDMALAVMIRMNDLATVLTETKDHKNRVLATIAKNINTWLIQIKKLKAIYYSLNLFNMDVTETCLVAECWVPVLDIEKIQLALRSAAVIILHCGATEIRETTDTGK